MLIKETRQSIKKVPIRLIVPIRIITQNHERKKLSLKPFVSLVALTLIISLNWVGLFAVGKTVAYYYDTELSGSNFLGADFLDFVIDDGDDDVDDSELSRQAKLDWGDTYKRDVKVSEVLGGITWKYQVRAEKTGGSDDLCNALDLKVFVDDALIYDGDLIGFISGTQLFSPNEDRWAFWVTLSVSSSVILEGSTCEYDFVYEGWQNEFPVFPNGFNDVERINNKIISGEYSYPIIKEEPLVLITSEPTTPQEIIENDNLQTNIVPDETQPNSSSIETIQSQIPTDEVLESVILQDEIPPAPVKEPVEENLESIVEANISIPEEIIVNTESVILE